MKYAVAAIATALLGAACQMTYTMDFKLYERDDPEGFRMLQQCWGAEPGSVGADAGQSAKPAWPPEKMTRDEALAFQRLTLKVNAGEPLSVADFADLPCVQAPTPPAEAPEQSSG